MPRETIRIYEPIGEVLGGISLRDFAAELDGLKGATEIDVRINSEGGVASVAIGMMNLLDEHPADIYFSIDSLAASAAAIIPMMAAPGRVRIQHNARMMIHNAWLGGAGDKRWFRSIADRLDTLDEIIRGHFSRRSKLSDDEVQAAMDAETWYTAAEALDIGLVDELVEPQKLEQNQVARAKPYQFNLLGIRKAPEELAQAKPPEGGTTNADTDEAEAVRVYLRIRELQEASLAAAKNG